MNNNWAVSTVPSIFASRSVDKFPSPWLDQAAMSMPTDMRNALEWCEYIYENNGTYRSAMERVISYFLTDLLIGSADPTRSAIGDDEKEKYKYTLKTDMDIMSVVQNLNRDVACYGNAFASLQIPFQRMLRCGNPSCGAMFSLRFVHDNPNFKFRFTPKLEFHATCPHCKYSGEWDVRDELLKDEHLLRVKLWNPKEIEIQHCLYTNENVYYWRVPEEYKRQVRSGELLYIERASKEVLKAIRENKLFMFNPGVIYHMREPSLSGRKNYGWGISRILMTYREIMYIQILRRFNEAIALDYVMPFRLITPDTRNGSAAPGRGGAIDPALVTDMGSFMGSVRQMLYRHRMDPATIHSLPFPVKYQLLGAEANALAPKDLIEQGQDFLLNAVNVPVEMYRGSLQLQAAPVSLRLFESTWRHLPNGNNSFLHWLVEQLSRVNSWEPVSATLSRVTYADDVNKQMMLLQLMMGQKISETTGLRVLGLEWKDETRSIAEETRYNAEMQAKIQEEMQQSAFGQQIAQGQVPGQAPPQGDPNAAAGGGAPAGGAQDPNAAAAASPVAGVLPDPNSPITPMELMQQADSLAQTILKLPESQKDSELRALKQKNEILHAVVTAKIKALRQRAQQVGGAQILGQA